MTIDRLFERQRTMYQMSICYHDSDCFDEESDADNGARVARGIEYGRG